MTDSSSQIRGFQFCWWPKDHSPPWKLLLQICKHLKVEPPKWRINLFFCELRYWG